MTQGELRGEPVDLVAGNAAGRLPPGPQAAVARVEMIERITRGGLPTLAGVPAPIPPELRPVLVAEYVEGVLHHETGRRHDRAELMRTLRYLASTTARILNVSTVAGELATARDTVTTRLATLETSFLLHSLPAHRPAEHRTPTPIRRSMRSTRRSPRGRPARVPILLRRCTARWSRPSSSTSSRPRPDGRAGYVLRHWRETARKLEVDLVIVGPDGVPTPIEVKAGRDVRPDDLAGLRRFLDTVPAARLGIVFHTGEHLLPVADRIWTVPVSALRTP